MKKQIAILATLLVAGGLSAFGQGYMLDGSGVTTIYNDTSGTGTITGINGIMDTAFLWAASTASDPLGAGLATTGTQSVGTDMTTIADMLNGTIAGWTVGENAGVEAVGATGNGGASTYNGGSGFAVTGTTAGATIEVVLIAWNNENNTITSLSQALSGNTIGFSSAFDYALGASSTAPVVNFNSQTAPGTPMTKFGVVSVPEPTTLALAGLGGLSMLFLRRRKA